MYTCYFIMKNTINYFTFNSLDVNTLFFNLTCKVCIFNVINQLRYIQSDFDYCQADGEAETHNIVELNDQLTNESNDFFISE